MSRQGRTDKYLGFTMRTYLSESRIYIKCPRNKIWFQAILYKPSHFISRLTYTLCTKPYNYILLEQGKEMNQLEEVMAIVLISAIGSCECVCM